MTTSGHSTEGSGTIEDGGSSDGTSRRAVGPLELVAVWDKLCTAADARRAAGARIDPASARRRCLASRAVDPYGVLTQDEVVARGRDGVEIALRHKQHQRERGHEAPQVESPLTGLADDEEDEGCVHDVVGGVHAAIIARPQPRVVGAGVETRVDSQLNPRFGEPAEQPA